jgi:tRNA1(Val) A37 N6-methylase TrmN6
MDVTHDAALGGRLRLTQPKRGHRFGHDAILLAAAVPAKPGERVVELGAGVGAAGLAVAARVPGIELTLIEIEPELTALASENIAANGFSANARALTLDVRAPEQDFTAAGLPPGSADHVLMNPPFNDPTLQASPDPLRRKAHAAAPDTLTAWVGSAARLLRNGGILTLIYRAERLSVIERAMSKEFGSITVLPIHSIEGEPPIRIICRAAKGARGALSQFKGFVLNGADRKPTAEAEAILRSGQALPFVRQ